MWEMDLVNQMNLVETLTETSMIRHAKVAAAAKIMTKKLVHLVAGAKIVVPRMRE